MKAGECVTGHMTCHMMSCDLYAAGPINYVDILKNEDGRSRGCAAVVFDSENDAEKAISES